MKSVLKVGVLAIALGMFVASCNNAGTSSDTTSDTANTEMAAPAPEQTAPVDSPAVAPTPADSAAAGLDTSKK